jgi:hypothetical protein
MLFDRAWALAERECTRALQLTPNGGEVTVLVGILPDDCRAPRRSDCRTTTCLRARSSLRPSQVRPRVLALLRRSLRRVDSVVP